MIGTSGPQGISGKPGLVGRKGDVGPRGPTGPIGHFGKQGIAGIKGNKGVNGHHGEKGVKGHTGFTGILGNVFMLISFVETSFYLGLAGLPGDNGSKGDIGNTGSVGATGPRGESGPQGLTGKGGEDGISGTQGQQGSRGEAGDIGFKGDIGDSGIDGLPGISGESLGYDLKILTSLMAQFKQNNGGGGHSSDNEALQKEQIILAHQTYKNFKAKFEKFLRNRAYSLRSCADVSYAFPEYESDNYLIDPNEGDISDAVLVYCNMDKKATCIESAASMKNGQLKFIKLLTTYAHQTIKFNCQHNELPQFDNIIFDRLCNLMFMESTNKIFFISGL